MATVYDTLKGKRGSPGVSELLAVLDQQHADMTKALGEGTVAYLTEGGNVSPRAMEFAIYLYMGGANRPSGWDVGAETSYWIASEWYSDADRLDRVMNGVNTARLWLGGDCLSWVETLHGTHRLRCGLTVSEAYEAGSALNGVENGFDLLGARTGRPENRLDARDVATVSAAPTAGATHALNIDAAKPGMTYTLPSVSSPSGALSTLVYKPGILSKAIILKTSGCELDFSWTGLMNLHRATEPHPSELGCSNESARALWGLLAPLDPSTVLSRSAHIGPKVTVQEGSFVVRSRTLMWTARVALACTVAVLGWMCSLGGDLLSAGVAGLISLLVAAVTAVIERGRVYGAVMKGLRSYPGGIGVLGDTVDDVVVSAYRLGINPFSENTCWAGSLGTGDVRCGGLRLDKLSSNEFDRGVLLGSDDKLYAIPEGPGLVHVGHAGPFTAIPEVLPERVGGIAQQTV